MRWKVKKKKTCDAVWFIFKKNSENCKCNPESLSNLKAKRLKFYVLLLSIDLYTSSADFTFVNYKSFTKFAYSFGNVFGWSKGRCKSLNCFILEHVLMFHSLSLQVNQKKKSSTTKKKTKKQQKVRKHNFNVKTSRLLRNRFRNYVSFIIDRWNKYFTWYKKWEICELSSRNRNLTGLQQRM